MAVVKVWERFVVVVGVRQQIEWRRQSIRAAWLWEHIEEIAASAPAVGHMLNAPRLRCQLGAGCDQPGTPKPGCRKGRRPAPAWGVKGKNRAM